MSDGVKRHYDNSRRRERAATTQLRIVTAARELLLEHGYAATTMAAVAASAGVAVQTVYSALGGGKAALVKRVWDVTIAGDLDPVPLGARSPVRDVLAEPDPARVLVAYARLSRDVYERLGPLARVLRAAAVGDPEVAQVVDTTERERLAGTTSLATHLDGRGALRPGLSVERAGHRLWVLNGGEVADGLVLRCGWTLDDYEDWMAESMVGAVLPRGGDPAAPEGEAAKRRSRR
jgi:AcrR family transcriptional regulator